jgi:hypothetical protein
MKIDDKLHPQRLVAMEAMLRLATYKKTLSEAATNPLEFIADYLASEMALDVAFQMMSDFHNGGLLSEAECDEMITWNILKVRDDYDDAAINADVKLLDDIGQELGFIPKSQEV